MPQQPVPKRDAGAKSCKEISGEFSLRDKVGHKKASSYFSRRGFFLSEFLSSIVG
jgi:hypothetical protein